MSSDMMTALEIERRALRDIAKGEPLEEVLRRMALAIESGAEVETLASILLTDEGERHLLIGAAPSLPKAYNDAIHGLEIGPEAGSCGTAVFSRQSVFVTDILQSTLWRAYEPLATAHGLRSCWSIPIEGSDGRVLGTFALYHRTPRAPTRPDVDKINLLGSIAAVAIERWRAEQALRRSEARCRELEAAAAARG
jgi:GAF domain-containing protein